jgi:hypothetical protein
VALPIYTQGRLDGLCGVYAFVNGYIHGCVPYRGLIDGSDGGDFSQDLCRFALEAIPKRRFPDIIWTGMDFPSLRSACKKACSTIERKIGFRHRILTPFQAGQFRSVEKFFAEVQSYQSEIPSSFAILGFEGRSDHWAAMKSDEGNVIRLLNNGRESYVEKSAISFSRRASRCLCQDETIIIQLLPD